MLPQAFLKRMQLLLGEEYEAFLASYQRPRNTALRRNPRKAADLPLPFCREAVPWAQSGFYCDPQARPGLHPWHDAGAYYLQEPSAMAPAALLEAQPGERILDLCAAPGSKSTQIAAAMEGRGLLVCNEIQPRRAGILSSNLERLGVANALVLNEHPAKLAQRFPAYFDRILVDAPCSGEGMFRKEDAAATDWSQETVAMCAARQTEILSSAAGMLAPGGRLVYSTCTFAPEENEGTVGRFLHTHPDFFIEQVDAPWFAPGRPDWISNPAPGLEHTFRLWPHRLHGEGHYAAVLCRKGDRVFRNAPTLASKDLPEPAQAFLHANGIPLPQGTVLSFGETWFLAPVELPPLDGLRVLRAGLELGRLHKGRFLPSHALALWLNAFPEVAELSPEGPEIAAYLRGETLRGNARGWVLVTVGGLSLGWARGADGVLKNHYPKGLRHLR